MRRGARRARSQVLVVGSGAGGATVALELARRGLDVLLVEEGRRHALSSYGASPAAALASLYRDRGMTPLLGRPPVAFVEGRALGGSTEVNSGFWQRPPAVLLERWSTCHDLQEASLAQLEPHLEWAEDLLGVGGYEDPLPPSSERFRVGAERMGWRAAEVSRSAPGCEGSNTCAQGCRGGAKRGMSTSLLPAFEAAGGRVMTGVRVERLRIKRGRVLGACATQGHGEGSTLRLDAEHVFVCCGPTQSPALLRRSGLRAGIGRSFGVHPMLKVTARFPEPVDAQRTVLSLLQVLEFRPEQFFGGAYTTPGHLALNLSEHGSVGARLLEQSRHLACYYVATRGNRDGSVRALPRGGTLLRYGLRPFELRNLSRGLARLSLLLLAAGAEAVYPSAWGVGPIRSEGEASRWLREALPAENLSLSTVHAFSSCPAGEVDGCPVDSFGAARAVEGLSVADASILPDAPGVNPQGTVMALARRCAAHFAENGAS